MKISEVLTGQDKWTQGVEARDATGYQVPPCDPGAVRFCLTGAARKCQLVVALASWWEQRRSEGVVEEEDGENLEAWNDAHGRTFIEVQRVIAEFESFMGRFPGAFLRY